MKEGECGSFACMHAPNCQTGFLLYIKLTSIQHRCIFVLVCVLLGWYLLHLDNNGQVQWTNRFRNDNLLYLLSLFSHSEWTFLSYLFTYTYVCPQFVKSCLSLLARLSRDHTIRYILVLIDDVLSVSKYVIIILYIELTYCHAWIVLGNFLYLHKKIWLISNHYLTKWNLASNRTSNISNMNKCVTQHWLKIVLQGYSLNIGHKILTNYLLIVLIAKFHN